MIYIDISMISRVFDSMLCYTSVKNWRRKNMCRGIIDLKRTSVHTVFHYSFFIFIFLYKRYLVPLAHISKREKWRSCFALLQRKGTAFFVVKWKHEEGKAEQNGQSYTEELFTVDNYSWKKTLQDHQYFLGWWEQEYQQSFTNQSIVIIVKSMKSKETLPLILLSSTYKSQAEWVWRF